MKIPKDVRLMIAVPTMGVINTELVARLMEWQARAPAGQLLFYFSLSVSPVDRARNQIVEKFLATEQATDLLMIDSDTLPPLDAIERLLSHERDIVTGLTPIASHDKETAGMHFYDNCFESVDRDEEGKTIQTNIAQRNTGLREIFRCGAACLLVTREVFTMLPKPYFIFETNHENTEHKRSEDIYFCDTAREAGFTIYADTDVICNHSKTLKF